MAWTQSDLDVLDGAIGQGVRTAQYQSGSVTYHSLDDMIRLRNLMRAEVAGTAPATRTVGAFNSGLGHGFLFDRAWWRN
jgi:hypothetical protein